MSSDPCSQSGLFDCIHNFVVAAASNEATEEQWANFERLLRESDDACRAYYEYVEESDFLQTILDAVPDEESSSSGVLTVEPQEPIYRSAPGFVGNLWHGTIGYFSQEIPFAILIATAIIGLGLWIGSLIHMSGPEQIEQIAENSLPIPTVVEPKVEIVGQITGMVDCKWEKQGLGIGDWGLEKTENHQSSIINHKSLVALGDKYTLVSGLMEITYNTGAKVILQGPVIYKVESRDSGFLSVGKLTARVEKTVASGQWPVASVPDSTSKPSLATNHSPLTTNSNPQSPIPNPLFSVRTPTTTVTDLGTEFGVEVSKEGLTKTVVFDGNVVVAIGASEGRPSSDLHLKAGEAVQIAANATKRIEWSDATKRFVRTIRTQHVPSPAPPLTVTDQLSLWLKADAGITTTDGSSVTAWADQSGQNHHATTNNGSPELRTSGLHGRPVVRFHGADSLSIAGQVLTSQQFTIVAVVTDTGSYDGHREIFSNWNPAAMHESVFFGTSTGNARSHRAVRFTDDFTPTKQFLTADHFVLTAISELNDARILVNGKCVAAKGTKLIERNLRTDYHVGYQSTTDQLEGTFEFWYGDIAELLVYNKTLSTVELNSTHVYLNKKYRFGTPVAPASIEQKEEKRQP